MFKAKAAHPRNEWFLLEASVTIDAIGSPPTFLACIYGQSSSHIDTRGSLYSQYAFERKPVIRPRLNGYYLAFHIRMAMTCRVRIHFDYIHIYHSTFRLYFILPI